MKKLLNTLYVTTPDRWLSLDGENVLISEQNEQVGRIPLHQLERIILFGGGGASQELIGKCAAEGCELVFMSRSGKFEARVEGEINGNVLLRRKQYRAADDEAVSVGIVRNMVLAELFNSRWCIERTIRDHPMRIDMERFRQRADILKNALRQAQCAKDTAALRSLAEESAAVYFSVFDDMILQQKDVFFFHGRNHCSSPDRVNVMLSFAHALAVEMSTSALEAVGLDPYVGFLHTDRPGSCSLALDLAEELRVLTCDRFVLMLINKRIMGEQDFIHREDGAVLLSEDGKRNFITAWQNRKHSEIMHPFLKEKVPWGMLPYVQAVLLARYLRGDLEEYPPFLWK